jgi:hypothetical protein
MFSPLQDKEGLGDHKLSTGLTQRSLSTSLGIGASQTLLT